MRAVRFQRFGPPEVLEPCELPIPEPQKDQVRVRIHATTVSRAETDMRLGRPWWGRLILGLFAPRRRFQILGNELAGEIDAVGERVTRFAPGDQVFGFAGFHPGANAEFLCLPETASLARKPSNKSYEESAAAVDGATTALYFLRDKGKLKPGQRALVIGASGSIGTFAVQLAKHLGAQVTGVCSSRNVELVKRLGADDVIDYTQEDLRERKDTFDIILDTVEGSTFSRCQHLLRPGGVYLPTTFGAGNVLRSLLPRFAADKRVVLGMSVEKTAALDFIRERLEADELEVVIDRAYPLAEIAKAHHHVGAGHKRGNVVIRVCGAPALDA